jgi:hypothetical protein
MKTQAFIFGLLTAFTAQAALAELPLVLQKPESVVTAQVVVSPESTKRVMALSATLQIDDILSVMRAEGVDYSQSLETEMFSGKGGPSWSSSVNSIYDQLAMKTRFDEALIAELGGADPETFDVIDAFFGSERGQRILTLEVEARRALLDKSTEEAAKAHFNELAAKQDPRLDLIRKFAEANDLIEMNVTGALNANLAFFKGMSASGGMQPDMTESQMLENVWSQEPSIRDETESWLYPYLSLAYQPLSDDDMEAYLAFSKKPEGKILNSAVFAAFNVLFTDISEDLGRAVAKQILGEDI